MLSRILDSRRRPCSCPDGRQCLGCKLKAIKPRVHLEDPHRLTIPIVISHYKHRSPTTVNRATEKQWPFGKGRKTDHTPARPTALCNWIRKKRALRKLKADKEREKQRQRDILRREREIEFIEQLQRQQQYEEQVPKIVLPPARALPPPPKARPPPKVRPPPKPRPPPKIKPPPTPLVVTKKETKKVTSEVKAIGKSTYAKPKAESKVVSVKKYCNRQTLTERFVNFCYRCCCQLYCGLTILILIGFAIILLI